mgnify:CR=1 FL=1
MNNNAAEVIGDVRPRFEFRTFGQNLAKDAGRMARLSVPVPENIWERHSREIYILSRTNDQNNTKIRDDKMDIKTRVQVKDRLEQWNPLMKAGFPISAHVVRHEVFPAFQVPCPTLNQEVYALAEFLEMIRNHPDLLAVRVTKQRFGYKVNNTICEYGIVWINGAKVYTLSSESTECDDIHKTLADIGLDVYENINYLEAIKRVTGMVDKPLVNE